MIMSRRIALAVAGFSWMFAYGAGAADTPPPNTQAEAPAKPDEIICKRVNVTGSRVGTQKVCQTAAEWDRVTRQSGDATRDMGKVRNATKGQ